MGRSGGSRIQGKPSAANPRPQPATDGQDLYRSLRRQAPLVAAFIPLTLPTNSILASLQGRQAFGMLAPRRTGPATASRLRSMGWQAIVSDGRGDLAGS